MKKLRASVWLTVIMAVYATAFFAYKFFIENVGVSLRNVTVVVGTYMLVAVVWWVNITNERKHSEGKDNQ